MDPVTITGLVSLGSSLIDKLIPDKGQADAAKLRLLELQQTGELAHLASETALAKGQIAVNAEEAKSSNLFVAGWRPAVGWCCVVGLFYTFLLRPLLAWGSGFFSPPIPIPPPLDMADLLTLLLGMLGLGAMRMNEKIKGVAR